jgi:hemerythrin-like metal-binding protein
MQSSVFVWSPQLVTGDAQVDRSHLEIFKWIERLGRACEMGRGSALVDEALAFLSDHGYQHFADEEGKMAAIDYPYLATHIASHRSFQNRLAELVTARQRGDDPERCARDTFAFVSDWFTRHIKLVDRPFIEFLRGERV